MPVGTAELVERLWARDAGLWTGRDEGRWLGWLDEPLRMRNRVSDLRAFAEDAAGFEDVVLLGMGGSSLAPELLRRTFRAGRFHVLDTTHPAAVRRLAESLDLASTLFLVSSKSGTTVEVLAYLDYFWKLAGGRGNQFVAITDPGSPLESQARRRDFRAVFAGEPTIGGRYSALSVFGMAPAALMGVDLEELLARSGQAVERARGVEGNEGLELGLHLGAGWEEGRDKILLSPNPGGFGLWVEQLLAESTGKQGKGLIPVVLPHEPAGDRQQVDVRIPEPVDVGAEFYRWEVATAVAGAFMGINPFDQPNVQEAKDRTQEVLSGHVPGSDPGTGPEGAMGAVETVDNLLAGAKEGDYVAIQAFVDPARENELEPLVERARATGCVVTVGLGPRYLHSTGQLHKGGPPTGRFVQVVDAPGDELPIPGRDFGFRKLVEAQADGDLAALRDRGRPIVRVKLEEVSG
ncbi:MAG: glucose-6-phosphate isomerase [Gaiellaceae bacterium]